MKKYLLNIILSFITLSFALGQEACFNADYTRGCAPFTVNMIDCSGVPLIRYIYGDGTPLTASTTHTYTQPGLYTVTQKVYPLATSDDTVRVDYIEVLSPRKPTYKLDICEGFKVTLTVNDNIDTSYTINFGDGTGNFLLKPNVALSHTYTDILAKTISITPISCGFPVSTTAYPIDIIRKPDISKVIVNNQNTVNGEITIQFNPIISQRYFLQQSIGNNSGYINIDTLVNLSVPQNIAIKNLNTKDNIYCYRLIAFDDCANPTKTSEEICSLIETVEPLNNQNKITWDNHYPGNVSAYHIFKDNIEISTSGTSPFFDNAVNCGVNYCYYIKAELSYPLDNSGNKLESITDTLCVTAISTNIPAAIQNLNSSINGSNISLTWDKPSAFTVKKYEVLRSVNGGTFTTYSTTVTNKFVDEGASLPTNSYCYKVNYVDSCDINSSSGTTTCPIIMDLIIDNNNNMLNHLSWSGYIGDWTSGINGYRIEKLDENNNIISVTNVNSLLNFDDLIANTNSQIIKYRIKAVANGPDTLTISYSNAIEIKYKGEIYLPNAFTPDGDGTNDLFFAKGRFISEYKLSIFNRWGEVVYSTEDFAEGWDGNYQGSPALNDAYAYLVEATDFWGKKFIKRGSVTLLR